MTDRYPDRAQSRGKARRAERQRQAEERLAASTSRPCGHMHTDAGAKTCPTLLDFVVTHA